MDEKYMEWYKTGYEEGDKNSQFRIITYGIGMFIGGWLIGWIFF